MTYNGEGMECVAGPATRLSLRACDCKGRRWTCKGCKRFVPNCNGGHSDDAVLDDLCDQCASVVMQQRLDRGEPDVQPREGLI